ncbi:MAG: CCA tRNA nucleotidyltransferase [Candidatus Micrarchaeota archaeon]|nr:CCA tRNA nucleotidyltransferase [Candidatus Micrarchaeota archaeon]
MDRKTRIAAQKIYKRVLQEIKPSKLEIETTIANSNRIMARLKKLVPRSVELMVVGSIARSTNLRGDHDIDIFMLFDKKVPVKTMERLGLGYGKRLVDTKKGEKYELKYAEHPYSRLYLNEMNIKIDLVPAYKIENVEELATAVDRTPFHTKFMNEHLSEKQRDEVRLLKYMLKNHNIYGAEVKIKGFSGYLCELLIYSFGSFEGLMESASNFKMPLCIVPGEKEAKVDKGVFRKFNAEFVVIDPVDKDRNVAAGVSLESLGRFVSLARSFVQKPDLRHFFGDGFSSLQAHKKIAEFVKKSNLNSYLVITKVPNKSEDIVWPQLKKTSEIVAAHAKRFGFSIYLSAVWIDGTEGMMLFLAPKERIETRLFVGPSIFQKNAAVPFASAHRKALGIFLEGDRIAALDYNKYRTLEELLMDVVKGRIIEQRKDIKVKGSKLLINTIPKEYSSSIFVELRNRLRI